MYLSSRTRIEIIDKFGKAAFCKAFRGPDCRSRMISFGARSCAPRNKSTNSSLMAIGRFSRQPLQ
jgi:hypothetical protein